MAHRTELKIDWRTIMTVSLALIFIAARPAPALAQQVVAIINGDPITAIDIAQRTKLIHLSTHKVATRQEVLDELIDEKLKLQIAKRYKLEITDAEVNGTFNNIASRAGNTPQGFAQALSAQGISPEAVKARIRADMGWAQIVRGKFQSKFQIRERDIVDTLQTSRKEGEAAAVGYEYTLRPILLLIPRGSPEPVIAGRKREAEGLRTRFQGCEEGLRLARGLKDIAVRNQVIRTSADLGAQLREILDSTQEGRLTPLEMTQQGIEMYALCGKRQTNSELPGSREVREKLYQERFTDQGKRYLKELRAGAMIEYRVKVAMPQPLALTIGEPAGIGPDITLAAWQRRRELALPAFYLLGDPHFLARRARVLGLDVPIRVVQPAAAVSIFSTALPVVDIGIAITAEPGRADASSAAAAVAAIRRAVADVLDGAAVALVTNPIAKSVLYRSGFSEPGHTEFLAKLVAEKTGDSAHPVMMLWSPELAVVPVTIHLPLSEVPMRLSTALIADTGRIVAQDLRRRFGIARPRLAVAGLNPHAGEEGALGQEDRTVVAPAVAQLQAAGIDAQGPRPADTMFHAAARATYDAALCMYHDQALIPIKTLAFDHAVNVTLGLPIVRTSPDHGTAFDIAGTGRADPASLIAALRLATRISAPAAQHAEAG